ncbi:MAG: hypothetical protein JJ855_15540 [Rhodospirillales bacterium]|nr:hypothetical protein [Rhodospirillales bacterium]
MRNTPELVDDAEAPPPDDESWTVEVESSPHRFPWLVKLGIGLAVFIILFISTLGLAPIVLPGSMTVDYAERLIGQVTGVNVEIKGDHSFRVLPSLRLKAENVVSADGPGAVFIELPYLELEASAFGALAGSVDVQRVMLRAPSVRVETGLMSGGQPGAVPEIDRAWGWWRDMTVEGLEVQNATFVLTNTRNGRALRLEKFSISNAEPGKQEVQDGIILKGAGVLNGQNVTVSATTSDPQLLVSGNRWPFEVVFSSDLLNGTFEGSLAVRERTVGGGEIVVGGSDAGAVNNWLGPLFPSRGNGPISLKAKIDLAGDDMDVGNLELRYGQTALDGKFSISAMTTGAPVVSGSIDATVFDFGRTPPDQVISMMEAPLMIPGMPSGKIQVAWQEAIWQGLMFGPGDALIERAPGTHRLTIALEDTIASGGTVRGTMTLDASEGMRALSVEGRAVGVDIGPMLLVGETGLDPALSGASNIELSLFSVGGSAQELLQALTGKAELVARDGSLRIEELIDGLAPEAGGKLDYASLNATFRVAQGIASSDDLLLRTARLSLVGKGRIDLANWTLDLDVGRLGTEGESRTLKRYRVSGPANQMRVEPINGS